MSKYLSLNSYNGTLEGVQESYFQSNGLPIDKALSPGGLSTLRHHWTEGMGGPGDITPDVFAGTGDRYIAGEYGNLYTPNAHASIHDVYKGPHTALTENTTLSGKPYYWMGKDTTQSVTPKGNRENFTNMGDFELIEGSATESTKPRSNNKKRQPPVSSSLETFTNVENLTTEFGSTFYFSLLILFFAFIVAIFWSDTIRKFIEQYINSGQIVSWQKYSIYSSVLTAVFLGVVYIFKVEKFT